ncbi:peptide ABC transporter ATP-binding protein [Paenibacillus antibioticophila]|uniref:Peptide ABC transporter ATP-binding protein n=1 Tax=Paenibacillus antibioticophila TaxID=1274374 RepID=A0A920CK51_9BACL|nr:ATP-binding cassette domain-containing protein [Paenibacillus antibioticophila]GIO40149.1 peptide ABC transporter ATP-binding protein [Paenibacillus antibioticophila]
MDHGSELLRVEGLQQIFQSGSKAVRAVDDISFSVFRGETFGLVGESGCGKSTTGRTIIQLYKPSNGKIYFEGTDLASLRGKKRWQQFRRDVQMIYQDPYGSLNPRIKIREIIAEGIDVHGLARNAKDRELQVAGLLETVGLNPEHANRYSHELSGGQRQRIGIARALAVQPKLIICDEPISALDVSIQAQIVNLLKKLQREKQLTYLFIAHDLSMVKYISNRIAVMYQGKIVELGEAKELYRSPLHPYTESLLSSIPYPDPDFEKHRNRLLYKQPAHTEESKLHEVVPGHFVFCAPSEVPLYQTKHELGATVSNTASPFLVSAAN